MLALLYARPRVRYTPRMATTPFRLPRLLASAALLLIAASGPAAATSFVMVADGHLADQAAVIAEIHVVAVEPAPGGGAPATDYLVEVERLIKGYTAGSTVLVRVPGGVRADGIGLQIRGAPRFDEGDRALLFLKERPDGAYGVLHLILGAFHEVDVAGWRIVLRDLSQATELSPRENGGFAATAGSDRPRDLGRFRGWLQERSGGALRSPDYFVDLPAGALDSIREKFNLFTHAGVDVRWFDFDASQPVAWRAYVAGQPGLTGGGFRELVTAIGVWDGVPGVNIRYFYAGTTSNDNGLRSFDGENTLVFNDPHGEIGTSFACGSGGTLAIGGPWFDASSTAVRNGVTYLRILGGDIVTNTGLECFFGKSRNASKAAEELFGHELGHTLGLAHSSDARNEPNPLLRDALMYAFLHDDGRGARLNADDRAAVQQLYGTGSSVTGGVCRPGAATLCLDGRRFQVTVAWRNQFDGTSGVGRAISRSDTTGFFSFGDPSNVELLVKILDFGSAVKVFYGELTDLQFTVTVAEVATGAVKTYANTAGDCGGIDQNAFDVIGGGVGASRSASRTAGSAAAGACRADRNTLCLLGGRFAATVEWANPGNGTGGVGGALPLSSLVGTFFFTDPGNVELMTKVIDFGDRVAFFYGSLSDLPYTIRLTDTSTGREKIYQSTPGRLCGGIDNHAF